MLISNAADPEVMDRFFQLCRLEPRLKSLYDEAKNVIDDPLRESFCAYLLWHGTAGEEGLKHRLKRLVGKQAGYPERTPDTLGIDTLFNQQSLEFYRFSAADKRALHREGSNRIPGFPKVLTTESAHDIAYAVLYNQLPECRNCYCL